MLQIPLNLGLLTSWTTVRKCLYCSNDAIVALARQASRPIHGLKRLPLMEACNLDGPRRRYLKSVFDEQLVSSLSLARVVLGATSLSGNPRRFFAEFAERQVL